MLAGILLLVSLDARAHMAESAGLQIIHPWAMPSEADRVEIQATLSNDGDRPRHLIAIETPIAGGTRILVGGRSVERLEIGPGDILGLEDVWFVLLDFKQPLLDRGMFPLLLRLADGEEINLQVMIGGHAGMAAE